MRFVPRILFVTASVIIANIPGANASNDDSGSRPLAQQQIRQFAIEPAIAGTKCAKIGTTKKVSATTYKCSKSGKSLKWIKVATSGPNQSTSTTASKSLEGTACSNVGNKSTLTSGFLECRNYSDGSKIWTRLSNDPIPPNMPAGGEKLDACKLREARIKKFQPWNVGFPRGDAYGTPTLPTSGRANVQLVAVDFSDAIGTAKELDVAQLEIDEFNKWFEFNSNTTLSFNWQFPKRWLRMSKPTASYALKKGDRATVLPMAQEVVTITDPFVDFTNSDFVFILFPRTIKLGEPDLGMANWRVESAEGPVKNLYGGSEYFYDRGYDLWSAWVHEWGHPMGLAGHAPRSSISMMDDHTGKSAVLNVWDAFFSGWLGSDQVYCMPFAETSREVTLIPLERMQHGPRGVIVPLSNTNALVIESHRAEGWGKRLLDTSYGEGYTADAVKIAAYGVTVYYVDTTMDTDRYGQGSTTKDSDVGDKWADNIIPPGTWRNFDLLLQGDKVSYRGVTVEFVKTGDYDTIKITK